MTWFRGGDGEWIDDKVKGVPAMTTFQTGKRVEIPDLFSFVIERRESTDTLETEWRGINEYPTPADSRQSGYAQGSEELWIAYMNYQRALWPESEFRLVCEVRKQHIVKGVSSA